MADPVLFIFAWSHLVTMVEFRLGGQGVVVACVPPTDEAGVQFPLAAPVKTQVFESERGPFQGLSQCLTASLTAYP